MSIEDIIREAVHEDLERTIEAALDEQRRILAPLTSCGDLIHRRASLTIDETAQVLGVSRSTVKGWIAAGELVPLDFSGARRLIGTDQIMTKLAAANDKRRNCGEAPK